MENNGNFNNNGNEQVTNYNTNYDRQGNDPVYEEKASGFLRSAIISCAVCSIPIGSIIAIVMGSKNYKAILEYLSEGGPHTGRIKTSAALSKTGKYVGVGMTIFWGFYLAYFAFMIIMTILVATGAIASNGVRTLSDLVVRFM